MASNKSAKKRIRSNEKKRVVNKMNESMIKTNMKKVLSLTEKEEADKLYREAIAILDRNAAKGTIHKNNAARKKAALTKHINSLAVPAK